MPDGVSWFIISLLLKAGRAFYLPLSAAGKLVTVKTFKTGLQTIFVWTESVRQRLSELFVTKHLAYGQFAVAGHCQDLSVPESVSDEMLNQTIKITASFDVDDFPSTWL
jgi:hypothetical protein